MLISPVPCDQGITALIPPFAAGAGASVGADPLAFGFGGGGTKSAPVLPEYLMGTNVCLHIFDASLRIFSHMSNDTIFYVTRSIFCTHLSTHLHTRRAKRYVRDTWEIRHRDASQNIQGKMGPRWVWGEKTCDE